MGWNDHFLDAGEDERCEICLKLLKDCECEPDKDED